MSALINLQNLKEATGYTRASDIEKCLRQNGVRFLYGKNGVFTTTDAFNAAMGLQSGKLEFKETEIEFL